MGRRHEWKDPEKIEKERLEALKKKLGDINDAPEKTVEMKIGESRPPMVDCKQAMASNPMAAAKTLEEVALGVKSQESRAKSKIAVILGHEVFGVQQEVIDSCNGCIEIPQYGTKHSMNVSVTAGIVLYRLSEAMRA